MDNRGRAYEMVALTIFHVILLLVVLNLVLYGFFKIRDQYFTPNPVIHKYGMERLKQVYPNRDEAAIQQLLKESWVHPMVYDNYTGFKERPVTGTYLNVSEAGYRTIKNQGSWPLDAKKINIFVFGGSKIFGYGVADEETVPSYLQEQLNQLGYADVAVYNFANGRYFSAQERVQFERLLVAGSIPNIAIFIDGSNEYHPDGEQAKNDTAALFDGDITSLLIPKIPMGRMMITLQQRFSAMFPTTGQNSVTSTEQTDALYGNPATTNAIIASYLRNKQMTQSIAENFNVKTLFVWEPAPQYKYDLKYDLFGHEAETENNNQLWAKYTYPKMAEVVKDGNRMGNNFLWAADMQANLNESLYVDAVHYAPRLSNLLAQSITQFLDVRHYVTK